MRKLAGLLFVDYLNYVTSRLWDNSYFAQVLELQSWLNRNANRGHRGNNHSLVELSLPNSLVVEFNKILFFDIAGKFRSPSELRRIFVVSRLSPEMARPCIRALL